MHRSSTLREVSWEELFPWLLLLRTIKIALSLKILVPTAIALALVDLGGYLVNSKPEETPSPRPESVETFFDSLSEDRLPPLFEETPRSRAWQQHVYGERLEDADKGILESVRARIWIWRHWVSQQTLWNAWSNVMHPLTATPSLPDDRGVGGLMLQIIGNVCIWALFGGAIVNMAVLAIAREERLSTRRAFAMAASRWRTVVFSVVLTGFYLGMLMLPLVVTGWLLQFDLMQPLVALLWGGALFWGLIVGLITATAAICWPFLWASVSADKSDAFDAASRMFAYAFQRLGRLFGCIIVLALLTPLAAGLGAAIAGLAIDTADCLTLLGAGEGPASQAATNISQYEPPSFDEDVPWALSARQLWNTAWTRLAFAIPVAMLWVGGAATYLLMRYHIDATEIDELVFDEPVEPLVTTNPESKSDPQGTD